MKVVGFSFIKNAVKYDFPVVESIKSVLPLCDKFYIAVGKSEDDTLELIRSIDKDKIIIIETVWDETLREGGHVLAAETNKAMQALPADTDWAIYIQGDELFHEKDYPAIRTAMETHKNNPKIEGLLFHYLHFYGSYSYVADSNVWYPNEIRIIKYNPAIFSYKDAQGFRKGNNEKLQVAQIDATVYHYGYVKPPKILQEKFKNSSKFYHDDAWIEQTFPGDTFDFLEHVSELKRFETSHPKLIQERIDRLNWEFDYDISMNNPSLKKRFKHFLRKYLGIDLGYKNYKLIIK
ncbi:MAG: glycosyltransferase family 2 protein [Bacteroidetes bacterium]|nr:glycosyltransferase family 2 protein [Bacteroidota bacterium]MDA0888618.1 glycosyltransferase family 2 protein [Bacteroidota bacterium]MDA1085012.1 glycosyltransferase family 2 protein [Bacteroidota bacterium]